MCLKSWRVCNTHITHIRKHLVFAIVEIIRHIHVVGSRVVFTPMSLYCDLVFILIVVRTPGLGLARYVK